MRCEIKLLTFDEAFKASADDIARGDGPSKKKNPPLNEYPEFGRTPLSEKDEIKDVNKFINSQAKSFSVRYEQNTNNTASTEMFQYVKSIGTGSMSTVAMVQGEDGVYYARKTLSMHNLLKAKKVNEAKKEKRILDSIRFPFTINLKYFYKDDSNLYFILPLIAGGSLYHYLKQNKRLKERLAKFIAGQTLLGLRFLHAAGLIHRDLKIENLLIDHYGYIKISNFGMSKLIKYDRTYTICGTAEYMAPEVIACKGYGLAADWWSFGVLVYELCNGLTPFYATEIVQTFHLIIHNDYFMPVHFSPSLSDLIAKLLQPDLSKRLGNLQRGIEEIINHNWFKSIENNIWLALINRRILSPIIPFISDENDNQFFERKPEQSTFIIEPSPYAKEFENF